MTLPIYSPKEETEFCCAGVGFVVLSPEDRLVALADLLAPGGLVERVREVIRVSIRACEKVKREYKTLQPDAAPDECWSEVEQLEDETNALLADLDALRKGE